MSIPLTADLLEEAARAGGPSCLSITTELRPAAGPHGTVAPAKFASAGRGESAGVYWYEKRFDSDAGWREVVIIDSKQSQLNRAEAAIQQAIDDDDPLLRRLPRIVLTYERDGAIERHTDLQLPHRVFDGHLRAGLIDGQPAVSDPRYRALRDATPGNARALLEASPLSLVFGAWDSSRRARQGRWRSALTGEIIGFCIDSRPAKRGGARVDPVAMQVLLPTKHVPEMVARQKGEMSASLIKKVTEGAKKAKTDGYSGSEFGLGGIPPTLAALSGVACDRIVRSSVLSFAALRQIRFGATPEGDAACRALLAALAINGLVRSYDELVLRANCDLVEAGPAAAEIDRRAGRVEEIELPATINDANRLLADALAAAEERAGIRWEGQVLDVQGDPEVIAGASDADSDSEAG